MALLLDLVALSLDLGELLLDAGIVVVVGQRWLCLFEGSLLLLQFGNLLLEGACGVLCHIELLLLLLCDVVELFSSSWCWCR